MHLTLSHLPFIAYSPSVFEHADSTVRLVFDGRFWWLFDEDYSLSFPSRFAATEWLYNRLCAEGWPE